VNERPTNPNEEYDRELEAAWGGRSNEEPPASVDDAIRAAARRAIGSAPVGAASTRRSLTARNWRPFAAVAAVAGLAFGLLRWLPRDGEIAPPVEPPMSRSESSAPALAKERSPDEADRERARRDTAAASDSKYLESPTLGAQRAPEAPRAESPSYMTAPPQPELRAPQGEVRAPAPPAAAIELPSPAAADATTPSTRLLTGQRSAASASGLPSASPGVTGGALAAAGSAPTDAVRAAEAPEQKSSSLQHRDAAITNTTAAIAAAPPAAASEPTQRPPEAWVHEIEALHAAGYDERAAEQLRKFRASYRNADQYLPDPLRPWAASVKD